MALIKCPECGKSVSDKTDKCPDCGYPIYLQNVKTIKCKFCGIENHYGTTKCLGCGAVLSLENEVENDSKKLHYEVSIKSFFVVYSILVDDNLVSFIQDGVTKYKCKIDDLYILYYSKSSFMSKGSLVVICSGMKTPYEFFWKSDMDNEMTGLVDILKKSAKVKTRSNVEEALRCKVDDMGCLWVPQ